MDGNGRWANRRGLPRLAGHHAGTENVRRITVACADAGVECLTIYAFSTAHSRRPAHELFGLMRLLA
ncbi:MAG: undecaprenyl diphosphate synthase family protein, partial [Chloroflexi bacterium]|nr:undecaprenyl diphosphate synthase family protein [Chloroflexota bacterium]